MPLSRRRPRTNRLSRPTLALALLLVAQHAQASDFSGLASVMFGIPTLLLLNVVLGMMLIAAPTRMVRFWAGFLGLPTLLAGFLLWDDAASLFRKDNSVPSGVFYFLLYASGVALLARHFLRRPALAGGSGN